MSRLTPKMLIMRFMFVSKNLPSPVGQVGKGVGLRDEKPIVGALTASYAIDWTIASDGISLAHENGGTGTRRPGRTR
jgi:hypothetical protein